jgi:hypothetical protein
VLHYANDKIKRAGIDWPLFYFKPSNSIVVIPIGVEADFLAFNAEVSATIWACPKENTSGGLISRVMAAFYPCGWRVL